MADLVEPCPICHQERVRPEPVFGPAYRECRSCGFLWRVDRENFPNPNQAYQDQDTEAHVQYLLQQEAGDARRAYYEIQLARLHRYATTPGRLLELGCGTGGFSHAAAEAGWEVLAVDSSPLLCREAERLLGAGRVLQAPMESAPIEGESFDVMMALDFIEHLPQPRILPQRARQWLKEGGVLLLQTPNARALRRCLQRRRWNQLKPEQHFLFHSASSLGLLFTQEGFEVLCLKTVSGTATAGPLLRAIAFIYGGILSWLGLGNTLFLAARKIH